MEDADRAPVVVVGAGLAGLTAARALVAAGRATVVVDKGRGVGGRLATRRIGPATVDHGAPVLDLVPPGDWPAGAGAAVRPGRWRGRPAMTALPKALAVGLDVRTSWPATAVGRIGDRWEVRPAPDAAAEPLVASAVVVTAPVPQARALLAAGGVEVADDVAVLLDAVRYHPALVALVPLDGPATLPAEELVPADPVVARIVDHHRRGTSAVPAITVEATAAWSAAHLDDPAEDVLTALVTAARRLGVTAAPVPEAAQVHRWRFARVAAGVPAPAVVDEGGPLVLAGDAFGPGDAAGAVVSGRAAARRVLGHLA